MTKGIVAAGHEETARAAKIILENGGNAFDAAVAAAFAACVAEPVFTSLGGGGFLLAHAAAGSEALYDFFVQTPRKVPSAERLDFHPIHADFGPTTQEFHIGLGAVATPGTVAGLFAVHEDLGSLPIQEVMSPAIHLCRDGFIVNAFQEYLFRVVGPIYTATKESRRIFGSPNHPGKLVQEGDRIRFPDLADTLEALSREGARLFYEGEIGRRLVEQIERGGILSAEDLKNYRVERRRPLEFDYRGHRILTNPPPSCGGMLIAFTLQLLEKSGLPAAAAGSAEDLIPLVHAMDLTNQARIDSLAQDPDWEQVADLLLDPEFFQRYRSELVSRARAPSGTTHLNVIDADGNVASMSLSNGEGCGHVLKGTGIMLNNMLGEEDINPMGFQSFPLNQRMSSMMSPTLLFQREGMVTALGSGGSNRFRTAIVQVLRHLVDHSFTTAQAVEASRVHYERGLLSLEPGLSEDVLAKLRGAFPEIHLWEEKNLFFGGVHAASFHQERGFQGMGDPRRAGVCLQV
jgi:gamma-glutamyltranspeptidase/glutathione hydrolase